MQRWQLTKLHNSLERKQAADTDPETRHQDKSACTDITERHKKLGPSSTMHNKV
jgi:hypothetical protein